MFNKVTGFVMLGVIFALIAAFVQQQYFSGAEVSRLQTLLTAPNFTEVHDPLGFVSTIASFTWAWFSNLFGIISFNYPAIFHDEWQIVRYIFCLPMGIGLIAAIISAFRGGEA